MRSPEADAATARFALWVLAALVTAAAAAGIPGRATYGAQTTADEPQYLLTALSLARDGDLDIADELAAEEWRAFHEAPLPEQTRPLADGSRVSPHDPLLPVLLAPAVAVGGWAGAKLVLAVLAGALAALTAWTAAVRFAVRWRTAVPVIGVLSASLPLAGYGHQVYPEVPAALAVTAAVALLTRGGGARAGLREPIGLWALVVVLPWLGIKYAPVAATLAALAVIRLLRAHRGRAAAGLLLALGVAGAAYLALHQAVWTGWTAYASADHFAASGELGVVGFAPDYAGRAVRLSGLLVDAGFGLAAWQPAWLALPFACAVLAVQRPRGWVELASPLAAGWLVATFVALTMHGWWVPGRQVVVVLPLAAVVVAAAADRWPVLRSTVLAAGVAGVVAHLAAAAEAASGRLTWAVDLQATANPLFRGWSALLPDYLSPGPGTEVRHWVWAGVLLGLAGAGARLAARRPTTSDRTTTTPTTTGGTTMTARTTTAAIAAVIALGASACSGSDDGAGVRTIEDGGSGSGSASGSGSGSGSASGTEASGSGSASGTEASGSGSASGTETSGSGSASGTEASGSASGVEGTESSS